MSSLKTFCSIFINLLIITFNILLSLGVIIYFIPYHSWGKVNCAEKSNFMYYMVSSSIINIFLWIHLALFYYLVMYYYFSIDRALILLVLGFIIYGIIVAINCLSLDILINQDILENRCQNDELLISQIYIYTTFFSPVLFLITFLSGRLY